MKTGMNEITEQLFIEEVLPRTVDNYYKGDTPKEMYEDFCNKWKNTRQILACKRFGYGEIIAIKIILE